VIELFDTSALILAARHAGAADALREAIGGNGIAVTDIVVVEYLNGARNLAEHDRFAWSLGAAQRLQTTPADWDRVLMVHRQLAASGPGHQRSVSVPDLIVAAVAERHGTTLVHYDEDYERIAAITGQPVRWVVPRGSA
jgi:predicted nucleic acid-binding protein